MSHQAVKYLLEKAQGWLAAGTQKDFGHRSEYHIRSAERHAGEGGENEVKYTENDRMVKEQDQRQQRELFERLLSLMARRQQTPVPASADWLLWCSNLQWTLLHITTSCSHWMIGGGQ